MRFSSLFVLSLLLAACSHEAENTGMQNSSNTIMMPSANYAMMNAAPSAGDSPVAAGHVSQFQRQIIVTGGGDGPMSPCAKNFDQVMDNLEGLMAPQIEENNRLAAQQAAAYPL